MKAGLQSGLPEGSNWLFEVKLDGIRAIAIKDGTRVQLFSRRPRDLTADHPSLVEALRQLPVRQFVADGEIVALDPKGRSSFQLLQNRRRENGDGPGILYYLFDLLHLNGHDLHRLPLEQRRQLLAAAVQSSSGPLRLSPELKAAPALLWKKVQQLGLEGLVAKQRDSVYEPGRRSGAWLKIKSQLSQEFVIGGYTPPEGGRSYFGSLAVGYYQGRDLIYASRVGTGFDFEALRSLFRSFQKLRVPDCPFVNLPTRREGRFGQGMTAAEMRRCTWLTPKLVCQVRFLEWTQDGNLRQPVFLGLREDKRPADVVRESVG